MNYYGFIEGLLEFGLITQEQADEAIEEFEREMDAYEARKEAFHQQWEAERAEWPWWKRFWRSMDSWVVDWWQEPFEVRWPDAEPTKGPDHPEKLMGPGPCE